MLSNFDLEDICEKCNFDLIGVFSKNKIPEKKKVGSYIINMQNQEDGNGTHWIVFKIFENGKALYFDSFGISMPKEIDNFLKIFKPVGINNRHIQDINSVKCGYFCIAFIQYFNNFNLKNDLFEAYDDFLNCFSNNKKKNDIIVMELLKKIC